MTTDMAAKIETANDDSAALIRVENLKKYFPIHKGVFSKLV
jgi:hypothetical protein